MSTVTHWAPWDAPRYRSMWLTVCGVHATDRELALHGKRPTCPICLQKFLEYELMRIAPDDPENDTGE